MPFKKKSKKQVVPYSTRDIVRMGILLLSDSKFWASHKMPYFTPEDAEVILRLLFFKPKNIIIKEYIRTRKSRELPLRRRMFIHYLLGEARFNKTKAAIMAGFSPRSGKQIGYHLTHNW